MKDEYAKIIRRKLKPRKAVPMSPDRVARAYNFPTGRSLEQQCVAIIELGGGFNPQDVYTYCQRMGYQIPELYVAATDGASNVEVGPQNSDSEVCLDIDVIAAVAQGVKILVVFTDNSGQGFADGILAAVNHPLKPCAISISWGGPINQWSDSDRVAVDAAIKQAVAANIPLFCASGDSGSADGTNHTVVDYPSCNPDVIACGGTHLELNAASGVLKETSWDIATGNGATGGGICTAYKIPDYQNHNLDPKKDVFDRYRLTPDISGNADPSTGYLIDVDGQGQAVGGTSAVAPLYAALAAIITSRLGQKVPNWHEVLYEGGICVDITGGSNGAYQCTAGFDLCTGLGTVDGEKLLTALAKSNNLTPAAPKPANPTPTYPILHITLWNRVVNTVKSVFGIRAAKFTKNHTVKRSSKS